MSNLDTGAHNLLEITNSTMISHGLEPEFPDGAIRDLAGISDCATKKNENRADLTRFSWRSKDLDQINLVDEQTDGWDRHTCKQAAKKFKLELAEMKIPHHLNFEIYEKDKLILDEYSKRVLFYQKRTFTQAQFRRFMFAQSKPYLKMIDLAAQLKIQNGPKFAAVSNEGRELNSYRIREFKLDKFVEFFISSCFVHIRKPDTDIFKYGQDVPEILDWKWRANQIQRSDKPLKGSRSKAVKEIRAHI